MIDREFVSAKKKHRLETWKKLQPKTKDVSMNYYGQGQEVEDSTEVKWNPESNTGEARDLPENVATSRDGQ